MALVKTFTAFLHAGGPLDGVGDVVGVRLFRGGVEVASAGRLLRGADSGDPEGPGAVFVSEFATAVDADTAVFNVRKGLNDRREVSMQVRNAAGAIVGQSRAFTSIEGELQEEEVALKQLPSPSLRQVLIGAGILGVGILIARNMTR